MSDRSPTRADYHPSLYKPAYPIFDVTGARVDSPDQLVEELPGDTLFFVDANGDRWHLRIHAVFTKG